MKKILLINCILIASLFAQAKGGLVSAGGAEKLVLTCRSDKYQISVIQYKKQLFASLVKSPMTNPDPVGKIKVVPQAHTGSSASYISAHAEIPVDIQVNYTNGAIKQVMIKEFGSIENEVITCN